jgi:small GTP-binding protein
MAFRLASNIEPRLKSGHDPIRPSHFLDSMPRQVLLTLIGDCAVGKTALVTRLALGIFEEDPPPTLGGLFSFVASADGQIRFTLWDTAGTEKYGAYIPQRLKNCHAALIVFDVAQPATFAALPEWVKIARGACPAECRLFLLANKVDGPRAVGADEGRAFAGGIGADYLEISAKTGEGLDRLLELLGSVASPPDPVALVGPQAEADGAAAPGSWFRCC